MKKTYGLLLLTVGLSMNISVFAESGTCSQNADKVIENMRHADFGDLSRREIEIARTAAMSACESTFTELETSLEQKYQAKAQQENGIDPEEDPIGWLKEQWNKEPLKKDGLERLKRRSRY